MKPYVVYWNNVPAPYMVERFNAIADRGNFDFEAWFNDRDCFTNDWEINESSWRFNYQYLPFFSLGKYRIHFPSPLFRNKRPDVLVSLYADPVFVIGWLIAKLCKIKTMFRTLVTFDSWVTRKRWKELFKRFLFSRVDGIETPGEDGRKFAIRCGASTNKIYIVSHAVDVSYFYNKSKEAMIYRKKIRKIFGLNGLTFIYVGRLLDEKGLNYLLDAFSNLQNRCKKKINLLLVGNGKDSDLLKKRCQKEKIHNVLFAGFWQKQDLPFFYAASDIFVFPTLGDPYGLVVNEAMACCLPVISTSTAGEIESRIENGVNGYIVPTKNSAALSKRMEELVKNTELRKKMGELSSQKIANLTPEKWAIDFENAIKNLV